MNKLKYTILVALILFNTACEDETVPTIIEGSVSDFYTENTIANINLRIYDITISIKDPRLRQINPYDSTSFVSKILVDNYGNFNLRTEKLESGKEYVLVFNDHEKFSINTNEIEVGKTNNFNMKLKYYNILKVEIKNKHVDADSLVLNISVDNTVDFERNVLELLLNDNFLISNKLDTTIFTKSVPDCMHSLDYRYFGNDTFIENVSVDEYILNVDTTEVRIELL